MNFENGDKKHHHFPLKLAGNKRTKERVKRHSQSAASIQTAAA